MRIHHIEIDIVQNRRKADYYKISESIFLCHK